MPAHKKWPPGTRGGRDRSDGRDGSGAKMGAQTPPSTRAGGQDDGSYTNSLKLVVYTGQKQLKNNMFSTSHGNMFSTFDEDWIGHTPLENLRDKAHQ